MRLFSKTLAEYFRRGRRSIRREKRLRAWRARLMAQQTCPVMCWKMLFY